MNPIDSHLSKRKSPPSLASSAAERRKQQEKKEPEQAARWVADNRLSVGGAVLAGLSLLAACGSQAPPNENKECAVLVVDTFQEEPNGPRYSGGLSHGELVVKRIEQLRPGRELHQIDFRRGQSPGSLEGERLAQALGEALSSNELSSEQSRELLKSYFEDSFVANVEYPVSLLAEINQDGFRNSVVNTSLGAHSLGLVNQVEAFLGPDSPFNPAQKAFIDRNLNLALELDLGMPFSEPTRLRFQALLDFVQQTLSESSRVRESLAVWRNEVRSFESANNSVVVVAGNDASQVRTLRERGYRVSYDADKNFLSIPEVTTVGAYENGWLRADLAPYSRQGEEVDLYANGTGSQMKGTSVAATDVTVTLGNIHCSYPEMSSGEAEAYSQQNLAEKLPSGEFILKLSGVMQSESLPSGEPIRR